MKQEALEGGFKQVEKEMFLFAHDYAEREMKSKASKSKTRRKSSGIIITLRIITRITRIPNAGMRRRKERTIEKLFDDEALL